MHILKLINFLHTTSTQCNKICQNSRPAFLLNHNDDVLTNRKDYYMVIEKVAAENTAKANIEDMPYIIKPQNMRIGQKSLINLLKSMRDDNPDMRLHLMLLSVKNDDALHKILLKIQIPHNIKKELHQMQSLNLRQVQFVLPKKLNPKTKTVKGNAQQTTQQASKQPAPTQLAPQQQAPLPWADRVTGPQMQQHTPLPPQHMQQQQSQMHSPPFMHAPHQQMHMQAQRPMPQMRPVPSGGQYGPPPPHLRRPLPLQIPQSNVSAPKPKLNILGWQVELKTVAIGAAVAAATVGGFIYLYKWYSKRAKNDKRLLKNNNKHKRITNKRHGHNQRAISSSSFTPLTSSPSHHHNRHRSRYHRKYVPSSAISSYTPSPLPTPSPHHRHQRHQRISTNQRVQIKRQTRLQPQQRAYSTPIQKLGAKVPTKGAIGMKSSGEHNLF